MTKIQVNIKNVYGQDLIYPACETAKNLTKLTGKKTLTPDAISIIKTMGFEIEVVSPIKGL